MFGWLGFFLSVLGCYSLTALLRSTASRRQGAGAKELKSYWEKTAAQTFQMAAWLYSVSWITGGIMLLGYQFYFKK